MKDTVHRSFRPHGGHKPYQDTPKGTPSSGHGTAPAASGGKVLVETTIHTLRQRIGGRWQHSSEAKGFEAELDTGIVNAIQEYLRVQHITCRLKDHPKSGETTVMLDYANAAVAISCSALKHEPKPLAQQFGDQLAMSRRVGGRG